MKTANIPVATDELAQLLKGVYERVSRELGLNPYYVSRAARGELHSQVVESALERELKKILAAANGKHGAVLENGTRNRRKNRVKNRRKPPGPRVTAN